MATKVIRMTRLTTGSSRKSVKSKFVCTGINFHKKMDSLGCFGIRNSDKFILHFNQVCFQIYGMAPPYRRQRADAPFTAEQEAWLILEYGAVKNISVLKRHFQQHFVITTRKVPSYMVD